MNSRAVLRQKIKARTARWFSYNWSGYALAAKPGRYTSVSGQWVVPRIRQTIGNTYSSAWVGIDGFNNSSLIQVGTESDFVNGSAEYFAWWEILPKSERRIPYPVSPGDLMAAKILKLKSGKWHIVLRNRTRGWLFRTTQVYDGPQSSVEFIQEAPRVEGRQSRLAKYKQITFDGCRVNGKKPKFNRSNAGVMIQGGVRVSTPSVPSPDGDGFTVAYGSNPPKARSLSISMSRFQTQKCTIGADNLMKEGTHVNEQIPSRHHLFRVRSGASRGRQ